MIFSFMIMSRETLATQWMKSANRYEITRLAARREAREIHRMRQGEIRPSRRHLNRCAIRRPPRLRAPAPLSTYETVRPSRGAWPRRTARRR